MLPGKVSFGEVKRLEFFILEIENNLLHNPVPFSLFQPEYRLPEMKSQSNFRDNWVKGKKYLEGTLCHMSCEFLNSGGKLFPEDRDQSFLTH